MINFEIPYGIGIQIKCPSCGYEGLPNSKKKGMILLEILLYICGVFPGIIYSLRRNSSRICRCPRCGEVNVKEINGDDELVNNLVKMNKIQNYAFLAAILIFVLFIFGTHDYKLSNQNQQIITRNINYQQPSNNTNLYNINPVVKNIQETKKENEEIEEAIVQPKVEEAIVQKKVEEIKDPNEEVREKMQNILKQIDYQYSEDIRHKVDSYIGASCSGDCIDGIINIKFAKNLGWEGWVVESAAAIWSNDIIRAIPGYFNKLQINYICHDQTITSCTFTEYQTNTVVPKGCVSHQYKDTKDEAREKMQNILKEIDGYYSNISSYVGASCLGDCTNGIVNIEFSENIGWWDFTVRAHAADWNNKIIKAIPGFFDKLRISFIYNGQTVCSCIFTEYQTNSFAPKGCTYYGYNE